MNVYAASDLHGNLPDVPGDADLLLLAGDICPDFRPFRSYDDMVDRTGQRQANWLDTEFLEWLEAAPCRAVATWGNHDFVGLHPFLVPRDLPWTLLKDQETTAEGLRVYGTPWVPGLPYWAFYGTPQALQARADAIPEGIDILMTHGPPYRSGDYIPTSEKQRNKYGNYGGAHVGDPTLNEAIERVKPKAVICGHIHEARGTYCLNGATVYNVAAVDALYDLYDEPFVKLAI